MSVAVTAPNPVTTFSLPSVEPWDDQVDGAELLQDARAVIERHVILPEFVSVALALWCMHAHALDCFSISPRLAVLSPEKQCGKTTLLSVIDALVPRPLHCANVTPAAIFRTIPAYRPTLLIDEADTFLAGQEALRGILNSGHNRQSARVIRIVGDQHEPKMFDTWAPVVIAAIKDIPETLMDRSVIVRMRRRLPGEKVERLRLDRRDHLRQVARKMARFAIDNAGVLAKAEPEIPEELSDRAQDNWRGLLAIADCAGGDWPQLAREAAIALSRRSDEDELPPSVQLLQDIYEFLQERDSARASSAEIVRYLVELEGRPWREWRSGQPITSNGVAHLLKPFGIQPQKIRFAAQPLNGYLRESFVEPVSRYARQA